MSESTILNQPPTHLNYSLTGLDSARAIERGLAEAEWYQTPVPRAVMRQLLERRDGPAIWDTLIWFGLMLGSGYATCLLWPSWWSLLPYMIYAVIYGSTSDARWHESSHGTAFKTDWMNNTLYEISSFMVMRESTVWRWSHTRHHSDTIIVGRDPEIAVPRPPNMWTFFLGFLGLPALKAYFRQIFLHACGHITKEEKTFIPESEYGKVIWRARIYIAIYIGVISLAWLSQSWMPLVFVGLPNLLGSWLMPIYGYTQHAGLAENVLDHRLNCRTVYMNGINRYLYWNMNYHVEHHMFPLVPYHKLPKLHEAVKADMPKPYGSIWEAYCELFPAVLRQRKDPAYHVKRHLPPPQQRMAEGLRTSDHHPDSEGWLEICAAADLGRADVIRFDHGKKTFALYRDDEDNLYATDGICTHGNTHLADGLVKGKIIECPKHNGRFNLNDGSPARAPVCRGIATYPLEERNGRLWLNAAKVGGAAARIQKTYQLRVVSNQSVATFIKELVLEPLDPSEHIAFTPGDYLQIDIPAYEIIRFSDFKIPEPYARVWEQQHVFDLEVRNPGQVRRNNYSLASNQSTERVLRFNVRIATPPPGQDCPPGVGSSYVFNLMPGDVVTAIGSFGDFHIKPTQREMVYIGGGAGMAPLRAHLSYLLETEKSARKISFWYGARSRQEIFYEDYFGQLADEHSNFAFELALSAPLPEDNWAGHTGFIHEVVLEKYLRSHANLKSVEFYLCGPPLMIKACNKMLSELGVAQTQIAFDEF